MARSAPHKKKIELPKRRSKKEYGKGHQDFLNSPSWRRKSKWCLKREPLCRECKKKGRLTASTCTDHIIPPSKDGSKWDDRNLQCLCHKCHGIKTAGEVHGRVVQGITNEKGYLIPIDSKANN